MNTTASGHIRQFSSELASINRVLDALLIWLSLKVLCQIFPIDPKQANLYQYLGVISAVLYLLLANTRSVYRSARLESYLQIAQKIISSWVIVIFLLIALAFLTKSSSGFSRLIIGCWLFFTPALLISERVFIYFSLRLLRSQGSNIRSYIIFGNQENGKLLQQKIAQTPWTGLLHIGSTENYEGLINRINEKHIDYVFITNAENNLELTRKMIAGLSDSTASVYIVPQLFLQNTFDAGWVTLGNTPMITVNDHPFYGSYWLLKKLEDLVLGGIIFLLTLPLMILIGVAVKLNSSGPILFKQRRYGLNGEVIQVLKFRTMKTLDDGAVVVQASKDDPRITSLGRFLRRTSLDELPQFWNVLQGSMSIVGPRPHAVAHNEEYRQLIEGYMLRHKVKPGITGWAQVNGLRGETETLDKMKARIDYDLYYINHWSIWLDLKIIFMTILNGFTGKSAY
ncbi:undecaprenyl-phosphate glucose phosphotransferase [Polynucleobacter asymbioticus]|uniref:undecaprenyl-phosphate glucose phosphotransferase n=1 Tax=Polynucleobacter asymbioticus TaxID=576611 RepID=UPI0008F88D95|nr:undecaprenyl-phosphate glucose phosphotransferase [Polynucleobacter asymbioticus]